MATATAIPATAAARPRQNWVLDPLQDGLFIIAAPLIMLALALLAMTVGGLDGDAVFAIFVVFNIAHHMPTFIRIYGDVDLFRRFRWSFLLGPLIPFAFALGVMAYIIQNGYDLRRALYLLIILSIWDPWHFLMQHYGFMRIYDRHNAAPRALSARMDLALSATWFVFIMLATASWLPDILYNLKVNSRIPLLDLFARGGLVDRLEAAALASALAMSAVYVGYLFWCARKGYYISPAKLALFAITYGVMYLTYTPNALIRRLEPAWSLEVGFAVLGMVHVTQYLAIVWKYNRGLAQRQGRARPGLFARLHERGGWGVAGVYVGICLAYGWVLSRQMQSGSEFMAALKSLGVATPAADAIATSTARWFMAVLLAVGFTSTLMHYYFDGFIWKIRHKQNQEGLALAGNGNGNGSVKIRGKGRRKGKGRGIEADAKLADAGESGRAPSWWDGVRGAEAPKVFGRHLLYFGLPMALLTIGTWRVWSDPVASHQYHMIQATRAIEADQLDRALNQAQRAVQAIDRQLAIEGEMIAVRPDASHLAYQADLIYDRSRGQNLVIGDLEDALQVGDPRARRPVTQRRDAHRREIGRAIRSLERALALGGPLGHAGRPEMTPSQARELLDSWRAEAEDPAAFAVAPTR